MFATDHIPAAHVVCRVPLSSCLNAEHAFLSHTALGAALEAQEGIMDITALALLLESESRNPDSRWRSFLDWLPRHSSGMSNFSEDDFQHLQPASTILAQYQRHRSFAAEQARQLRY